MNGEDKETVIRLRGVVNRIGGRMIHDHVDLDVYRGEVLGVVGGSGAGKSVLLRSIVGLRRPQAGSVEVFGQDVLNLEEAALRLLQMRWGVLFQDGALFSSQTVAENIQVPLREYTAMSQRADERDRRDETVDGRSARGHRARSIPPSCPAA